MLNFTHPLRHEIAIHNSVFSAKLIQRASLMEVVQAVTLKLGTQPVLPDWIITGTTLGLQRGTDEVRLG